MALCKRIVWRKAEFTRFLVISMIKFRIKMTVNWAIVCTRIHLYHRDKLKIKFTTVAPSTIVNTPPGMKVCP